MGHSSAARRAAAALLCCVAPLGCGGGSNGSGAGTTPVSPTPSSGGGNSAAFAFRASPIDPSAIEFIAALGNLNPPDHTLPTDHIYLYHRLNNPSSRPRTVVAPADGTIQSIISHGDDVKVLVRAASSFTYYLDHLVLDASVHEGVAVTGGQRSD